MPPRWLIVAVVVVLVFSVGLWLLVKIQMG